MGLHEGGGTTHRSISPPQVSTTIPNEPLLSAFTALANLSANHTQPSSSHFPTAHPHTFPSFEPMDINILIRTRTSTEVGVDAVRNSQVVDEERGGERGGQRLERGEVLGCQGFGADGQAGQDLGQVRLRKKVWMTIAVWSEMRGLRRRHSTHTFTLMYQSSCL